MLGEQVRRTGFFAVDRLHGGHVTRHLKDIRDTMAGRKDHGDALSDLLRYAIARVPSYKDVDRPELDRFPIVTKQSFIENLPAYQSADFKEGDLHWVSTSGTTGTPFKSSQNPDKRNRTIADLIYFHGVNGWSVGDRYVFLRAWTTDYIVSDFKKRLQNYRAFDLINFNDAAKEAMRQTLINDKAVKVLIGYAAAVGDFLQYLEAKGDTSDRFHLKAVFTDSEILTDSVKSRLEKMFACPVMNRYSNEEQGVLACTTPYSDVFQLNTASYHFELLKLDRDEPVQPGELGRVIVTDLYNRSTLFIRYDTNDLAISDDPDMSNLKTLRSLQGRMVYMIRDPDGNAISATTICSHTRDYYKLRQYQVVQDGRNHYQFKVVCDPDAYPDRKLIDLLQKVLGPKSAIDIVRVDHIPLEKSGKYVSVKNQWKGDS